MSRLLLLLLLSCLVIAITECFYISPIAHQNNPTQPEYVDVLHWRQPVCLAITRDLPACTGRYNHLSAYFNVPIDNQAFAKRTIRSPKVRTSIDFKHLDPSSLEYAAETDIQEGGTPELVLTSASRSKRQMGFESGARPVVPLIPIYVTRVMDSPVTATLVPHDCLPNIDVPLCPHQFSEDCQDVPVSVKGQQVKFPEHDEPLSVDDLEVTTGEPVTDQVHEDKVKMIGVIPEEKEKTQPLVEDVIDQVQHNVQAAVAVEESNKHTTQATVQNIKQNVYRKIVNGIQKMSAKKAEVVNKIIKPYLEIQDRVSNVDENFEESTTTTTTTTTLVPSIDPKSKVIDFQFPDDSGDQTQDLVLSTTLDEELIKNSEIQTTPVTIAKNSNFANEERSENTASNGLNLTDIMDSDGNIDTEKYLKMLVRTYPELFSSIFNNSSQQQYEGNDDVQQRNFEKFKDILSGMPDIFNNTDNIKESIVNSEFVTNLMEKISSYKNSIDNTKNAATSPEIFSPVEVARQGIFTNGNNTSDDINPESGSNIDMRIEAS